MQGQSTYTRFKQERFKPVFAQSLYISKAASVARFAYYHIDLNAGSGFNEQVGVVGSPINFLDAVTAVERANVYAFFVECNEARAYELGQRLAEHPLYERLHLFNADNNDGVLSVVSAFIAGRESRPELSIGSIVIDPNGYHKGVPWQQLSEFCTAHPRFDVFVNLNARSFGLERPHILEGSGTWGSYTLHPPSTFADWFHRPHWMWATFQGEGPKWIQGVGRSMKTSSDAYTSLGFYAADSWRGREILASVERTSDDEPTAEAANQLSLLSHL